MATIEWASYNSMALWELQPALGYVEGLIETAFFPALIGILVCPIAFVILTCTRRLSGPTIVCCLAFLVCSALTMIPAIQ